MRLKGGFFLRETVISRVKKFKKDLEDGHASAGGGEMQWGHGHVGACLHIGTVKIGSKETNKQRQRKQHHIPMFNKNPNNIIASMFASQVQCKCISSENVNTAETFELSFWFSEEKKASVTTLHALQSVVGQCEHVLPLWPSEAPSCSNQVFDLTKDNTF